jgi:hypothetical protein
MIDRKTFFAKANLEVFRGAITQKAVQGISAILDEWERRKLTDLRHLAYMLATVRQECGANMLPVREGFAKDDASARLYVFRQGYKYAKEEAGHVWYGRGLVQLTWFRNYQEMNKLLGVPLLKDPDLALRPDVASKIMFEGMIRGVFTGKKLSDYFNGAITDWYNARRIINGLDSAARVATWGKAFHAALVEATKAAPPPIPQPPPPDIEPPKPAPKKDKPVQPPVTKKETGVIATGGAFLAALATFVQEHPFLVGGGVLIFILLFVLWRRKR